MCVSHSAVPQSYSSSSGYPQTPHEAVGATRGRRAPAGDTHAGELQATRPAGPRARSGRCSSPVPSCPQLQHALPRPSWRLGLCRRKHVPHTGPSGTGTSDQWEPVLTTTPGPQPRPEQDVRAPTLKTNISLRRTARVLKSPSQMLGLAPGAAGLPVGGRGGRGLSFLRGSAGGTERCGGTVGRARVGGGVLSGGPSGNRRTALATPSWGRTQWSSVGHGLPGLEVFKVAYLPNDKPCRPASRGHV